MQEDLVKIINNELQRETTDDIGYTIELFDSKLYSDMSYIKQFVEKKSEKYELNEIKILFYKFFGISTKGFYKIMDLKVMNDIEEFNLSHAYYAVNRLDTIYSFYSNSFSLCKKSKSLYNFLVILVIQLLPIDYVKEILNTEKFIEEKELIEKINYLIEEKSYSDIIIERDSLLSEFNTTKEYSIKRSRKDNI